MAQRSTLEFAANFAPYREGVARLSGRNVWGIKFPCYIHPEPVSREDYGGPERTVTCHILLNDDVAYHVDDHDEVTAHEAAAWFTFNARRWLQPWRTLDQICRDAEGELKRPWLWANLLRPGAITLLVGPPKLGKSTLTFDFLAAMASNRGECIGQPLSKANVLYVSEEGEVPLAHKGAAARLLPVRRASYVSFLTSYEAGGDWPGLMSLIERASAELPGTPGFLPIGFPLLVVIDTLGFFMGLDDENQAGAVRAALKLLVDITRKRGLAVLLIHHTNKRGAKDDQWVSRVQGSTAFAGNVDIVAALDGSYTNKERKLYCIGRFGTPDPLDLVYDEDDGYRQPTEAERQSSQDQQERAILEVLAGRDRLPSQRTLAQETGLSQTTISRALKRLRETGRLPV